MFLPGLAEDRPRPSPSPVPVGSSPFLTSVNAGNRKLSNSSLAFASSSSIVVAPVDPQSVTYMLNDALAALQMTVKSLQGHLTPAELEKRRKEAELARSEKTEEQAGDGKCSALIAKYRSSHERYGEDSVPMFRDEREVEMRPHGYIHTLIHKVKLDPEEWQEFNRRAKELRHAKKKQLDAERQRDAVACNIHDAFAQKVPFSESPFKLAHDARMAAAKEAKSRRQRIREESAVTMEQRMAVRREALTFEGIVFCALFSRSQIIFSAILSTRQATVAQWEMLAALKIQRFYRWKFLGQMPMTMPKAFVVRARLLKRFVTRWRIRTQLPRYAVMVSKFLKGITFATRILMSFRHFHVRVVRCQRLVRRWKDDIMFVTSIRERQWAKAKASRHAELVLLLMKGNSFERDFASREIEALNTVTDADRDEAIARYRRDTKAAFLEAARAYDKMRLDAKAAGRMFPPPGRRLPKPQPPRAIIPKEQIARIVRQGIRNAQLKLRTSQQL